MKNIPNFIKSKARYIIFDKLPVTSKSCFCLPLKSGSIIIATLCSFISLGDIISNSEFSHCYPGIAIRVTSVLLIIAHVILILASIYFVYHMVQKRSEGTMIFLWSLLLVIILTLIKSIVWLFTPNINPERCPRTIPFSTALFMRALVFGYFLIVVNSYRVYHLSENREDIIRNTQEMADNIHRKVEEKIESGIAKPSGK